MNKVINVHMVTTGHMEEAMLFREIAHSYGAGVKFSYGQYLPSNVDVAVFGVPKNYHNIASSRPFLDETNFNRKLCRVPLMSSSDDSEYVRSKSNCVYGIHLACRFILDIGFEYEHPPFVHLKQFRDTFEDAEDEETLIYEDQPIVWFDVETSSLDPFTGDVVSVAYWFECQNSIENEWPVYFLCGTQECRRLFDWLVEHNLRCGAVNGKFEQKWCIKYTGTTFNLYYDAQVDYALLNEEDAKDLDVMAMMVGWYGYSLAMTEFLTPMNKHRTVDKNKRRRHHEAPVELLMDYNCKDAYVSYLVSQKTRNLLNAEPGGRMPEVADWLVRGQSMLARMEMAGMKIDGVFLMEKTAEIKETMAEIMEFIQEVADEYDMANFNMNSAPQKQKLLFEYLDYPVFKLTNKRHIHKSKYRKDWWKGQNASPSTDAESIAMILDYLGEDELLEKMNEYNTLSTILGTFVTNFENALAEGDGHMRSNFSLTKLVTGQLSSSEPPMQNIPKSDIRRAFISRFKGGYVAEIDYSQLHLRIIGNLAQCDGFIEAYSGGVDLHSRTAAKVIAGIPEDKYLKLIKEGDKNAKEDRQTAKRTNFSIIFEIGAKALASKTGRTEEDCKRIINSWFEEYPEIKDQIDRQHDYAELRGYVISPFGRVRHLPNARLGTGWLKQRTLRQAGDFLVSNSGRYMTMYGMIKLDEAMVLSGMKSKVVLQVHDSVVLDIHPDELNTVLEMVKTYMLDWVMQFCQDWMEPIELEMDGFIGPNWHAEDAQADVVIRDNSIKMEWKHGKKRKKRKHTAKSTYS